MEGFEYVGIFSIYGKIRNKTFQAKEDFCEYLLIENERIDWAKLIFIGTGELIDEFTNIDYLASETQNGNVFSLAKIEDLKKLNNFNDVYIMNIQCLDLIDCFINKYSNLNESFKEENTLNYYHLGSTNPDEPDYTLPGFIIVDKKSYNKLISKLYYSCKSDYKRDVLEKYISMLKIEIQIEKSKIPGLKKDS